MGCVFEIIDTSEPEAQGEKKTVIPAGGEGTDSRA
jgi:hypothetical protein